MAGILSQWIKDSEKFEMQRSYYVLDQDNFAFLNRQDDFYITLLNKMFFLLEDVTDSNYATRTDELLCTTVELPEGVGAIHVPSLEFNRYYILLHCYNHTFSEGLGLRQIMDLYFVLNQGHTDSTETSEYMKFFLDELGLRKFASAMMWIMGRVFDLERKKMLCEPDEKESRYILNEVMQKGNMGHHDARIKRVNKNARWQSIAATLLHNWHLTTHYPSEFF